MWRLIAALAVLWSGAAQADWQYTRWGMSPAEVVESSKGAVRWSNWNERNIDGIEVVGRYSTEAFDFTVTFDFKLKRLVSVRLDPTNPAQNDAIRSAIMARYGNSLFREGTQFVSTFTWRDGEGGNLVKFIDNYGMQRVSIVYSNIFLGSGL